MRMFRLILIICLKTKLAAGQISGIRFHACDTCPEVTRTKFSTVANSVFENSTYAVIANHKPSWDFYCKAKYPIEWLLHFHEREHPELHQIVIQVYRDVDKIQDPSTYSYRANLKIEFYQGIRYFPNFTCQAVQNSSLLTRLVTSGDDDLVRLSVVSTPNDHRVNFNYNSCKTRLFFSLRPNPGPGWEHGPCYSCVDSSVNFEDGWNSRYEKPVLEGYFNCENLFHCRSLYQHLQNKLHCIRAFAPDNKTGWPDEIQRTPADEACTTQRSFKPFVVYCKPLTGPVDVAQVGFYGVRQASSSTSGQRPIPYIRWSDAKQDMIQLVINVEDVYSPIYELQNISVTCRVSKYYCAYFARLGIQWNEGTFGVQDLSDTFELWKANDESKHVNGYYEQHFNISLVNHGNLSLYCLGPVINSSEWISNQTTLKIHPIQKPKIVFLGFTSPVEIKKLRAGAKEKSLTCSFEGEPISSVAWQFNNESALPVGSKISTNGNTSVLLLPEIFLQLAGFYTCRVQTFFDYSEETFTVDVEEARTSSGALWIIISTVLVLLLTLSGIILFRVWRIMLRQKEAIRSLTESEIEEFLRGKDVDKLHEEDNPNINVESIPYDPKLEIEYEKLKIDFEKVLGIGEFGLVCKGQVTSGTNEYVNERSSEVAVKTVKENVSVDYFKALLSEIKVLAHVGENENIVQLLGACTENIRDRKVYIVVEFCEGGCMLNFLKQNRPNFHNLVAYGSINENLVKSVDDGYINGMHFDTKRLFMWSADIANGLQHIHEKKVIHGDLAARNILLSSSLVAKISDFGLSRQLAESGNYVKKTQVPLPWRHMSPESLQYRVFSAKSDMWAFGITLWEMFSLGETPYGGVNWSLDFAENIRCGVRLNKPMNATHEMYEYMWKTWTENPEDRPMANELLGICNKVLGQLEIVERRFENRE